MNSNLALLSTAGRPALGRALLQIVLGRLRGGQAPVRPADAAGLPRRLQAGQAVTLDLPRGLRLAVDAGRVWLTRPGDPDDLFLSTGQGRWLPPGRRLVIEADAGEARLTWTAQADETPAHARASSRRERAA